MAHDTEIKSLRDEARNLWKEAQQKFAEWQKDRSKMPADGQEQYEKLLDAVISKNEEADRLSAMDKKEASINSFYNDPDPSKLLPVQGGAAGGAQNAEAEQRQVKAWGRYLTQGPSRLSEAEVKDLQVNNDSLGGFLVAPQLFIQQIIKFVDDMVFIRNAATKFQVPKAQSLGAPSWDTDPADADWTGEVTQVTLDTSAAVGKRELRPWDLTKEVKISKKLLAQAIIDPAAFVAQRLAYKFGITQEKAFLSGTGANQPLGLFTASANGVATTRDVTAVNATSFDANDFKGLLMSLKVQYQAKATWVLHRDVLKDIMELEDTQGRPLYADLQGSAPPTLVGKPYILSEYAPNTVTSGLYTAICGDLSFYWIADAMDTEIQALVELYAETNQNAYIARGASDGMPVLAEAFARLKMA